MIIDQELFTKTAKDLSNLERNLSEYKKQVDFTENEYNLLKNKVTELQSTIKKLERKRQGKLYSYDRKIEVITLIFYFIILMLYGILMINLTSHLKEILSLALGLPTLGLIEFKLFKKITRKIKDKIHNKIIYTKNYQDLLIQIKDKHKKLTSTEKQLIDKELDMNNAKSIYNLTLAERNMKLSLLTHMKNASNNISYDKETDIKDDEHIESKPYTRKNKKNQ